MKAAHARRAILARQYRRGYLAAVEDILNAARSRVSAKNFGRLEDWQTRVLDWNDRQSADTLLVCEVERAPRPRLRSD
jgi:hypothetical protein